MTAISPARAALFLAGLILLAACGEEPEVSAAAQGGAPAPAGAPDSRGLELIAEAEQMANRGDAAGAERMLDQAFDLFRRARDTVGQGRATLGLARLEHFGGQGDAARRRYAEALAQFREAGAAALEAHTLMALGDLEKDTFQWDAARAHYRAGRAVWATAPEPKSDDHVLLRLDSIASMPDGADAAWEALDEAELLLTNVQDTEGLAAVAMARARIHAALGDEQAARGAFRAVSGTFLALGNARMAAVASLETARYDIGNGYNVIAGEMLDQAALALAAAPDPESESLLLLLRAELARLEGELADAAVLYADAAARATNDSRAGRAQLGLAQVSDLRGDADGAAAAYHQAAAHFAAAAAPAGEAAARIGLANARMADAPEQLASAIELARAAAVPGLEARALLLRAEIAAAAGETEDARAGFQAAASLFAAAALPLGVVVADLGLARLDGAPVDGVAAALAAIESPVREANRLLGLPAVATIDLDPAARPDTYNSGEGVDPDLLAAFLEAQQQNLRDHPGQNPDANAMLAKIAAALADTR